MHHHSHDKQYSVIVVLAAAQNNPTSGWEAKTVEFFKDKLKEKDAQTWVMQLCDTPDEEVLQR